MLVTQKCQYAIKALFDLALRNSEEPVRIADIAEAQGIPARFLEIILGQLKRGGFVASKRGAEGGYLLQLKPARISIRDVVLFIDGPFQGGVNERGVGERTFAAEAELAAALDAHQDSKDELFAPIWRQAQNAVLEVYGRISIADLVRQERERNNGFIPNYTI